MLEFSPTRDEICMALVAFRSKVGVIKRESSNPFFNSKYAELSTILRAIEDALEATKLTVIQAPFTVTDAEGNPWVNVETMLLHESGEFVTSTFMVRPSKDDPQGLGSAVTYARRYSLLGMVGLAPEDDDGNAASEGGDRHSRHSVAGASPKAAQATVAGSPPGPAQEEKQRALERWNAFADNTTGWFFVLKWEPEKRKNFIKKWVPGGSATVRNLLQIDESAWKAMYEECEAEAKNSGGDLLAYAERVIVENTVSDQAASRLRASVDGGLACELCGEKFASLPLLSKHMQDKHVEEEEIPL